MISIISTALRIALPFVEFFFARSKKKDALRAKMMSLADKYNEQVLKNAKLTQEYERLKKELSKK